MESEDYTDSDNTAVTDEQAAQQHMIHALLQAVIVGVIGFVSVTGNLIALGTLIHNRKVLRTPIYIVIGGLALADIVVSVMNVPEEIINKAEKGDIKSPVWCKVYGLLFNSCQYIAAFHLVVLSVFRGILLTDRAHHGPTAKITVGTCFILWAISLLANIPMVHLFSLMKQSNTCTVIFGNNDEKSPYTKPDEVIRSEELYLLLSAAFSFFLPLVLIFVIYLVTGYMSQRYFEDSYSRRERRLSKMITYLIVVFAMCHLPSEMVEILLHYQLKNTDFQVALYKDRTKFQVWNHVNQYLSILAMLDMALRPVIYATMSREFGAVYDSIINCTACKKDDDEMMPPQLRRRQQEIEEVVTSPNSPLHLDSEPSPLTPLKHDMEKSALEEEEVDSSADFLLRKQPNMQEYIIDTEIIEQMEPEHKF
ncbi:somatostatin receptor type 5-like [Mya arenaria]|uniref:somatostatin receptor type 5-like n=1 Tax=Mya arenaria TaxID=6604 RepID=UPI0022E19897|nr:somatostatin receptor type 5-like [Mya arenaria]XP_052793152.1 somatostatin receptor type 5-like [Mya arenaria]XP_052793153.1 somatostatin receptor type 5-like [Mya arenaria]XP_052793154.1 somatostatin receptor type 5-like [Mya arenaria]XP_052793155.1 somatostatin receptor type 5-like [Mya arenaria]XP_052793156.1 somatostatin receptor type 5-like [Mya arenaria]